MKKLLKLVLATSFVFAGVAGISPAEPITTQAATVKVLKPTTYLGVKVNADTLLEQKIAVAMLKGQSSVDVSEFKEIKDFTYLHDRAYKVFYQNPLILGIKSFGYSAGSKKTLEIYYTDKQSTILKKQNEIMSFVKKVHPTIIKKGMTVSQKNKAIFDYLETWATYDKEANKANQGLSINKIPSKYWDSYSAYGVLMKKKGVCSSYASAYKLFADMSGLDAVVVTGKLKDIGAHAWVKVKVDNQWVHIDPTNNFTVTKIKYYLFEANDAQALSQGFIEDKLYMTDEHLINYTAKGANNDYFVKNKLVAENIYPLVDMIAAFLLSDEQAISIRIALVPDGNDYDGMEVPMSMNAAFSKTDYDPRNAIYYTSLGFLTIVKEKKY